MAFCNKCGTMLPDGTAFCNGCGAPQGAAPIAKPYIAQQAAPTVQHGASGRLHCPNCKGVNLSPVVESTVNGALTTSHGNFSSTRVSNTHRNFWMCGTCGSKFRNIQNLEEEIVTTQKTSKTATIFAVITAILCAIFYIVASNAGVFGIFYWSAILFTGLFAIVSFCYIFVYRGRVEKMQQELAYLKQQCFN